jgi:NAD(P)-dependent dehydrogenase (short-subunit alcohol dehydrogenase family)
MAKTWLITGSSRGFGRELAQAVLDSGDQAVLIARHFVQFSSIRGRVGGTPGLAAYQTAKFAVEGFSEVLSNELKPLGIKVTIIEPGAFRTDWGGSSMTAVPVSADYDQTVGEWNRYRESTVSTWPGDPARAAKIITDIVRLDEPPLRLLVSAGAVESARQASQPGPPKPRSGPASAEAPTSRPASDRPRQRGWPGCRVRDDLADNGSS